MAYTATEVTRIGLSGGEALAIMDVSPDGATGDFTVSDATSVKVLAVVPLIEDPAANAQVCVQAKEDSTTANKVNCKLWQSSNSAAATNFKDFRVILKIIR